MITPHPLVYNVDMHYLYLLKSKRSEKVYIGTSSDLKARLFSHNSGQNKSTKSDMPWELIYYEAYQKLSLARIRER
jgi:putative endonuclease